MATKNIVPRADLEGGIGTESKKWASGSFGRVNVSSYVSGSAVSTASFGTYIGDGSQLSGIDSVTAQAIQNLGVGIVSSSVPSSPSQGTVRLATNGVNTDVDTGLQTADTPTFAGITTSGTGSFGRIEATAITASRVDVDSGTIAVGGQPINSTLVQNISNTFSTTEVQSAGETTGSFGRVEASVIQANRYIVSSSVTRITTQELSGSTRFGDSSDDTHQFTGSLSLDSSAFKYGASTWKEVSGVNEFTGSSWEFKATKGSGDLFNFVDNSNNLVFKAQQDKVFVFGAVEGAEPTPIAGGLIYSGSDAWYLGFENDPT
tara:strand:- start:45 stop:998 length:954 start_codon:yes stop_codon:yes gene_type:complete